jgi:outer membrane protein
MTAPELLKTSERLVLAGRFADAKPLVAAMASAPELAMERAFLEGYIAVETGDATTAVKQFRQVLAMRPDMTRARLELARALMIQGKDKAADYHYRLAEEDGELPPDVARTIYSARSLIRDRRTWDVSVDFGFAPDTNINSATTDRTIDVAFGNSTLPVTLDPTARKTTGVGQVASVSGSVRLRLADGLAMVVDADGNAVNYRGTRADDISSLVAAGPELTFTDGTRVTVQALGSQRWYGGQVAAQTFGARANVTRNLGEGARIAGQIDARRVESGFAPAFDGWQFGGFISYEQVLRRSMVASLTGFVRREPLRSDAYSNTEFGMTAGVGGELPWGLNAGLTGQVSRANFDAPLAIFGETRRDWRMQGRAYLGARDIRLAGFSPSLTYTYSTTRSTIDLYDFDRHRVEVTVARYF